jgi:hypothetical protein
VQNGGSYTLPGGTFYFNNLTINGPFATSGPATIYVTGTMTLSASITPYQGKATNLKIRVVSTSGGSIDLNGNRQLYADIYAPYAGVAIGGTGDFYGVVVAKTVSTTGAGQIHYDESIPASYSDSKICLVE